MQSVENYLGDRIGMSCIYCKSNNIKIEKKGKDSIAVGNNFVVYIGVVTCLDCQETVEQLMVDDK